MISKDMTKAINEQINKELFSAYLYQSMSAWAASQGYKGTANWLQIQMQEEMTHAQKFYHYILDQGEEVVLGAIDKPENKFSGPKDIFTKTLEHEKKVTASINSLAALAQKENDMATFIFLQWFITEQVEEEASAQEILDQLKIMGDTGPAIYMLDKELSTRVFTPPAAAAE